MASPSPRRGSAITIRYESGYLADADRPYSPAESLSS